MDTESLWFAFQRFVEAHGWKLLAAALLLLVVQRRYREHAVNAHAQRALADANDPSRVAVLQRETARIRDEQQSRLNASATKIVKRKSKRAE
ncbi:hypothetical protein Gpo141_00008588 [Globisporangium polare]